MYTIKEAAARSGVSVPTLRAWERRYGVVHPVRTPSGYRLYDEGSIARLRAMRELVDEGWGASQAAQHVIEQGSPPAESVAGRAATAAAPDRAPARPTSDVRDRLGAGLLAAAVRLDAGRLDALLDDAFASASFERAMDEAVFPMLTAIGDAWQRGEIDIAGEHAASHAVVRRLARLFDAAARGDRAPRAVLGLPAGSLHEIGLLAFGVAARRAGVPVLYLGPDVPPASWAAALDRSGADIVVLGVPTAADRPAALAVLEALAERPVPPSVLLGGTGAATLASDRPGVALLPGGLDAAAATLATIASARGAGRRRARPRATRA